VVGGGVGRIFKWFKMEALTEENGRCLFPLWLIAILFVFFFSGIFGAMDYKPTASVTKQ
jgi:hypothetical protein